MNEQNLQQNQANRTPEQRREAASKAGKESGRKRRERKSMRESAELILGGTLPLWTNRQLEDMGIRIRSKSTVQEAILMEQAAIALGLSGAKAGEMTRAAEFLRDTVGDKNAEKLEVGTGEQLQLNLTVIGDGDEAGAGG